MTRPRSLKLIRPSWFLRSALLLALVSLFANLTARASSVTDGQTPLGLQKGAPAGSYALSGFDNVNLFNGGLNFRLLLAMINGRGGAGTSVMLPIEQRWRVSDVTIPQWNGGVIHKYFPVPNWWDGLPLKYSPGLLQGRQAGYGVFTCPDTTEIFTYTVTRLTFTASDGTEYELRDQLTGGQPHTNGCVDTVSRGTTFITADGTAATFISDSTIYDQVVSPGGGGVLTPSGYLMLRDGTRYRVDNGAVSWVRDRNGNKTTFTYDGNMRLTSVKDSINRVLDISYGSSSDTITFKGFDTATRTITVNYASMSTVLRSGFSIQTYKQLFPELNAASQVLYYNPTVVSSVTLPNNQQYQFQYNSYGDLARVVLPTGGAFEYDYATGIVGGNASGVFCCGVDDGMNVYRRVIERRVYADGTNLETKMTYSRPEDYQGGNQAYVLVDQYASDGTTRISQSKHYFYGKSTDSFDLLPHEYPIWNHGREYQTDSIAADGSTVLKTVANTWQQGVTVSSWNTSIPNNPRISEIVKTLTDVSPNLVSKQTFGYDDSVAFNNQNNVKEYDFGSGSAGSLLRETRTTFITSSSYVDASNGAHLRNLASQVSVFNGSGVERARTTTEFDNYATDSNHAGLTNRSGISGLDSAFTTSYTTRGNATSSTSYFLNTSGSVTGSISTYAQFDIAGNVVKAIDGRGNATEIYYDDCFGAPNGNATTNTAPTELSSVSQISYAFPTSIKNPLNQWMYAQFDYHLGRVVDGQDVNGIIASGFYENGAYSLDRPAKIIRANGVSGLQNQTTFAYDDSNRTITTAQDMTSNTDGVLVGKIIYDGMGRTIESRQYEGGSNYIAVKTQYDSLGRPYKSSNPYRPWQSESELWTTTAFDALGRVMSVTTPDSAVVSTAYSGDRVLVTDQAGKERISKTNALGQLKDVWEVTTADAATESISFPNHSEVTAGYRTNYSYDTLDNMTTVSQGSQTRTFVYDSLKRLTSATNPESGTQTYTYDNNGNLLTKTEARSITTTIAYDVLNRATSKSYNDSPQTATVNYYYDSQTLPSGAPSYSRGYSTGRLVAVTYGGTSAGSYSAFDALGRVTTRYQQTDSVNYLIEATYNLADKMTGETYPSVPGASDRRSIGFSYDSAGRLSSLSSSATSYAPAASVSSIGYASHNALNTETYGNSLIHAVAYNNRLQANEIKLGTSGNPTSIMGLTYSYGTTTNNGNAQSVSYSGGGLSYTQNFGYDALNRLTTSNENSGSNWSQTNAYDRYGNRQIDYGGGSYNLSFSSTTNRITTSGYIYDSAGNLTNDTVHTYTFDAENKILKVDNVSAYLYDGEGQRVRKFVGENTRFIYGIGGQMIGEFDGATGNLKKEYVAGGASLITIEPTAVNSNGARYSTADHLGSPRVLTNSSAGVVSRHDYMPFGEEIGLVGGRTTGMGFSVADGLRQKFTSKERDNETGLDYFLARYYSNSHGRFTSPDEFTGGPDELFYFSAHASANPTFYADLLNPQSLNKYQYAYNNPLRYIDPDGHDPVPQPDPEPCCETEKNVAKGAVIGAAIGLPVGAVVGAVIEGGAGTLVAPGVGTIGGGLDGAKNGAIIGTVVGAGIGAVIGYFTSTSPPPMPTTAAPQTTTPPTPIVQPMPPPPPAEAHTNRKRKSTKDKHETGTARTNRDYGREKGDHFRRLPRKPPRGPDGKKRKGPWPPKPKTPDS